MQLLSPSCLCLTDPSTVGTRSYCNSESPSPPKLSHASPCSWKETQSPHAGLKDPAGSGPACPQIYFTPLPPSSHRGPAALDPFHPPDTPNSTFAACPPPTPIYLTLQVSSKLSPPQSGLPCPPGEQVPPPMRGFVAALVVLLI